MTVSDLVIIVLHNSVCLITFYMSFLTEYLKLILMHVSTYVSFICVAGDTILQFLVLFLVLPKHSRVWLGSMQSRF